MTFLGPTHRDSHTTSGVEPSSYLRSDKYTRYSRIRWSADHIFRNAAWKSPMQRGCQITVWGGHNSIYFQRKGSGSSFSFSSHFPSVICFCHPVLMFSLCMYPLLKLLTPNHSLSSRHFTCGSRLQLRQPPPGCTAERCWVIWTIVVLWPQLLRNSICQRGQSDAQRLSLYQGFVFTFSTWISCQYLLVWFKRYCGLKG